MDISQISDDELERRARECGPGSMAAKVMRNLSEKRAQDRQVFAWEAGDYYFIGPLPDALTEAAMIAFAEEHEG